MLEKLCYAWFEIKRKVLTQMEKIKDFLHDYSDIFLALLIMAAMFMVVYINLNTIFDDTPVVIAQPADSPAIAPDPDSETIVIDVDIPSPPVEEPGIENSRHETEPEQAAPPATTPPDAGELVTVTIPNGTPGIGIARILVEHQLLPDTDAFVASAESLELSLKLKSGTFQIPAGSTPEEMVLIIARQ
jgi:hypothetical protein